LGGNYRICLAGGFVRINKWALSLLTIKLELSQDEFARKADVPYTSLTKIETGVIKKPSVFVMAKIAKTQNISLDDLLK